jgi:hypothetical protein
MREDLLLVSAKGMPASKSTTSQPRFAHAVAMDVPVYACAYDCNAFSNQLITLNCVHLNSVHRLVLPFCEAFSSPIFPTHNLGFAWGILEFKCPSNFLPKSVSSSSKFTDDFSGVTGIYELKMTPKFRVKI